MQRFSCDCGNRLFFENTECLACEREVGWCPYCQTMTAMEEFADGMQCVRCERPVAKCSNRVEFDVCNRNLPVDPETGMTSGGLCDCCRYNDTIPDLSVPGNHEHWLLLEQAKRRLIHGLDGLGLPHGARADGFSPGLSFDFKGDSIAPKSLWRTVGKNERVFTGHADGKITINIREADAVEREKMRVDLGEAHRTVIGHFRHEIGHYYWDLLIEGDPPALAAFKDLFGDPENPTYGEALERHYAEGPPADWQDSFISAYATMHPWEDWAETFAFYLDVVDVMETASASGLMTLDVPDNVDDLLDAYARLGILLNELNRGMGLIDFVPELVVPDVVEKVRFVRDTITKAAANASQEAVAAQAAG
ncbi:MAG: putative zinc-binding metallopeptidase [Alphaproteobacteria bacterium]|nr:putative zinc-binding metallopeptidase [Alphaproteobacteria bacterium]